MVRLEAERRRGFCQDWKERVGSVELQEVLMEHAIGAWLFRMIPADRRPPSLSSPVSRSSGSVEMRWDRAPA